MSIPTTIQFIVRGKSVDFKNREGSSPSIPKSLFNSLTIYPILFSLAVQNSLSFSFTLLFPKRIWVEMLFSYHKSYNMGYMIHVQINIFEQGISIWMIHERFISLFVLKLTKFSFWKSKKFQGLDKTLKYPFVLLIDINSSPLVKWGWSSGNSRDSSAGRAEDWKSSCHQFKSGSWHILNLYKYL